MNMRCLICKHGSIRLRKSSAGTSYIAKVICGEGYNDKAEICRYYDGRQLGKIHVKENSDETIHKK